MVAMSMSVSASILLCALSLIWLGCESRKAQYVAGVKMERHSMWLPENTHGFRLTFVSLSEKYANLQRGKGITSPPYGSRRIGIQLN